LIPTHLTTRGQLNSWEQANISLALEWLSDRREWGAILQIDFVRELHRRMFDNTWRWAGRFRDSLKNIGVAPHLIQEALLNLLGDATYQMGHRTYPIDETAARFHHRLVSIHPFPNGNGRHARLAADALVVSVGSPPLTWGSGDLTRDGTPRSAYLHALRSADNGDIAELVRFARS
jgi:Fic-DOC domain mobile mystery protein B